ncbi:hypothetical protein AJ79_05596 [Helicocarpus griseus UAMH5409]|uniref:Outer spore wall protein RRT8 n=1 Tax=Helicocarpus griseus UAMH5409 TaxID=1447875 RepID=A0A2B7XLP4_9EURO|nr:hypothetical protein AJ79_05596 [Helicocarpus griseus UAMH5409]
MADRLKAILLREAKELKTLLSEAVQSGTYLYPFQGILYFLTHRPLWSPLLSQLLPTLSLSLAVTATLFFFTYLPQVALLAFTSGPLAPFSAILLILSESSTITTYLSRTLLLRDSLTDVFDGTLLARGDTALVSAGRQLKSGSGYLDPIGRLGGLVRRPLGGLSVTGLVRSLVYLPLNMVPVVGTVMYVLAQGKRVGPAAHERYFQLKGWDGRKREAWVGLHRSAYTSFGAAAFVLEMIPVASLAFSYTNTVGAALWASNLEKAVAQGRSSGETKKTG